MIIIMMLMIMMMIKIMLNMIKNDNYGVDDTYRSDSDDVSH